MLPKRELFTPRFFAHCDTQGLFIWCSSSAEHSILGRLLRQRLNDHAYYSANGKMLTQMSRHLYLYYKINTSFVSFIVLAVVPKDSRGGNWDKLILQKKTLWFERLDAIRAPGFNETQTLQTFSLRLRFSVQDTLNSLVLAEFLY